MEHQGHSKLVLLFQHTSHGTLWGLVTDLSGHLWETFERKGENALNDFPKRLDSRRGLVKSWPIGLLSAVSDKVEHLPILASIDRTLQCMPGKREQRPISSLRLDDDSCIKMKRHTDESYCFLNGQAQ